MSLNTTFYFNNYRKQAVAYIQYILYVYILYIERLKKDLKRLEKDLKGLEKT